MELRRHCQNANCPNRGHITVDTNFALLVIEGMVEYVLKNVEGLHTKDDQIERIVAEIDITFRMIETCCALGGTLHTSSTILRDEILVADPDARQLGGMSRFTRQQVDQMLACVQQHLGSEFFIEPERVGEFRAIFDNPTIRPHDRDATLLLTALDLAKSNEPTIILSRDPDFADALQVLLYLENIHVGNEDLNTAKLMNRGFLEFITRIHASCSLPSDRYKSLISGFLKKIAIRLPDLEKNHVINRETMKLNQLWEMGAESVERKAAQLAPVD